MIMEMLNILSAGLYRTVDIRQHVLWSPAAFVFKNPINSTDRKVISIIAVCTRLSCAPSWVVASCFLATRCRYSFTGIIWLLLLLLLNNIDFCRIYTAKSWVKLPDWCWGFWSHSYVTYLRFANIQIQVFSSHIGQSCSCTCFTYSVYPS